MWTAINRRRLQELWQPQDSGGMDERHPEEEPHELEVKVGVTLWVETLEEFMANTKLVEETEQIRQSQLMKTFYLQGKEIQFKLT